MNRKAFQRAKDWVDKSACEEVKEWMKEVESDKTIVYYPNGGFVKIAFTAAFRHLLKGTNFKDALKYLPTLSSCLSPTYFILKSERLLLGEEIQVPCFFSIVLPFSSTCFVPSQCSL